MGTGWKGRGPFGVSWGQGVGAASSRGGPGVWGKDEVRWGAGRESEADEGLACGGGAAGLSSGVWGGGCKPEVRFGVWGGGSEAGGRVLGGGQSIPGGFKSGRGRQCPSPSPSTESLWCLHARTSVRRTSRCVGGAQTEPQEAQTRLGGRTGTVCEGRTEYRWVVGSLR